MSNKGLSSTKRYNVIRAGKASPLPITTNVNEAIKIAGPKDELFGAQQEEQGGT